MAVVYEKEINKKLIFDYFKLIPFTLIRSNHEINKIINFSVLREYLNLSPLEEFNNDYFEYYQQKLLLEKKNNVKVLYNTSKIKIVPYFNSINMNIEGYIVSDLFELKNATADVKLKSIKAISKIIEEYNNPIISISLEDMFNSGKPYLAYINCLKKVCSNGLKNVKILTNYDKEKIIKIKALWNEFEKYLYINEKDSNFYDLMLLEDINGICLSETEYLQVSLYYPNKSNEITEFWMNKTKKVFVYVKQNDIIKYHNEKILLILGE